MIDKIEFKAKNLTSNAGLFLMLENTKKNGIFELIENDLTFESDFLNEIKVNRVKIIFAVIDKLERLNLLKNESLVREFNISVKEPETVSCLLSNFSFKTK